MEVIKKSTGQMRKPRLGPLCFFLGLTLALYWPSDAFALRRVALIIGNAKYEHAGPLANTVNDAHAIAETLKRAGFDKVDERDNLGIVAMKRVVRDFATVAHDADMAVIYYSGHGIEASGVNYLIPIDAKLASSYDIEDEAMPVDRLLSATAEVKVLSLIILDACRENPFLRSDAAEAAARSARLQPEQVTAANTLIAYAAKAGSLSYDGAGPNSPFTTALIKYITEPGTDIRIALGKVRDDVLNATESRQEPFVYGSLGGDAVSLTPGPARKTDPLEATAADFAAAARASSPEAWRAFIDAHPEGGFYVDLARSQIGRAPAAKPAGNEVAVLPPPPKPDLAPRNDADECRIESERLADLRVNPTADAVSAFASEMKCSSLRPQLARLVESAGLTPTPKSPEPVQLASRSPEAPNCSAETKDLARLRAEPDLGKARALFTHLTCSPLRPQLQRLLESLGEPTAGVGHAVDAASPPNCAKETATLVQLRAHPDPQAIREFSSAVRCKELAPQAKRLLESLGD